MDELNYSNSRPCGKENKARRRKALANTSKLSHYQRFKKQEEADKKAMYFVCDSLSAPLLPAN